MWQLIKNNRTFLIPYVVLMLLAGAYLVLYSKADIHLYLNKFNNPFFDFAAKYITYLGDGTVIFIFSLLVLLINVRSAIFILGSYLISGLFAQIFKRFVFGETPRPAKFFDGLVDLHLIDGVKLYSYHSFPSGHATTAFAVFFIIAMMTDNRIFKFLSFIVAVLVAYSRVYLSQHFLVDIVAGSVLGICISLLMYYWINPLFEKNNRLNQSLITIFKKSG